jgi:type IV secretory pathway VirB10-like protein
MSGVAPERGGSERDIAAALRLRPDPPRVVRLSRRVLIGLGVAAGLGIGAALIVALQGRSGGEGPRELYSTDRNPQADGLAGLPHDYAGIPQLPGADEPGYAGLEDGVDYHRGRLFLAAGLATLLNLGLELGRDDESDIARAIRESGQDTVGRAGEEIVRRQLSVPPTLTVRPGFPVRVIVHRDLVLEPYGG